MANTQARADGGARARARHIIERPKQPEGGSARVGALSHPPPPTCERREKERERQSDGGVGGPAAAAFPPLPRVSLFTVVVFFPRFPGRPSHLQALFCPRALSDDPPPQKSVPISSLPQVSTFRARPDERGRLLPPPCFRQNPALPLPSPPQQHPRRPRSVPPRPLWPVPKRRDARRGWGPRPARAYQACASGPCCPEARACGVRRPPSERTPVLPTRPLPPSLCALLLPSWFLSLSLAHLKTREPKQDKKKPTTPRAVTAASENKPARQKKNTPGCCFPVELAHNTACVNIGNSPDPRCVVAFFEHSLSFLRARSLFADRDRSIDRRRRAWDRSDQKSAPRPRHSHRGQPLAWPITLPRSIPDQRKYP